MALLNTANNSASSASGCPEHYLNCDSIPFYYKFENISYWNVIAVASFNFLVAPFTFFFNFLALYTVYRRKRLRTMSNLILCNLAVTDMMTGTFTQPFFGVLMLNSAFCKRICFINNFTIFTGNTLSSISVASLFLITLDRHLSIFHPFYYVKVKDSRVKLCLVISSIWIGNICMISVSLVTPNLVLNSIVSSTLASGIFFWSLYVNVRTAVVVKRIQREIASQNAATAKTNNRDRSRSEVTSRVSRVAFTILGSMLVCYLPFVIFTIVEIRVDLPFNAWVWISTFVFLNSLINPLVYCWQMREIREEMKVIINRIFCCRTIHIIRDRISTVAARSEFVQDGKKMSVLRHSKKTSVRTMAANGN